MSFCYYPNHEYGCEYVGHCPHLGGAGSVVREANGSDDSLRYLHGRIAGDRERIDKLTNENDRLKQELEQVKLERRQRVATVIARATSTSSYTRALLIVCCDGCTPVQGDRRTTDAPNCSTASASMSQVGAGASSLAYQCSNCVKFRVGSLPRVARTRVAQRQPIRHSPFLRRQLIRQPGPSLGNPPAT